MLIKGSNLNAAQRKIVLDTFVHRWTHENASQSYGGSCPACVQQNQCGGKMTGLPGGLDWHEYHKPLTTDAQWLEENAFYFTKDGSRLMANKRYAEPAYAAEEN